MAWESSLWDRNRFSQNVLDPSWNFDRRVTVHLPEALPTQMSKTIFDASPATYSVMVPRLAVPPDVSGRLVYTSDSMSLEYPPIPPRPKTFEKWRGQLPSAEQHLLRVIT